MANNAVKNIIDFVMEGACIIKNKQQKDRKTSFFRTVLKHLKRIGKKKLKNVEKNSEEIIDQLQ